MSKSELGVWDSILIGPICLVANQYFNTVIPEYPLLLFFLVSSAPNTCSNRVQLLNPAFDHATGYRALTPKCTLALWLG